MAFRLTPQDTSFHELFAVAARHGVAAAEQLVELAVAEQDDRPAVLERLSATEATADETTHEIVRTVSGSFITPFDHVDIVDLAAALDTCVDELEATGALVVAYRMGELPTGCLEVTEILARMATLTAEAMPRLRNLRHLEGYWTEVNRLENRAAQIHRRLLGELFDGRTTDPVEIIKRKDVLERLSAAADAFETVAHRVERIVVKGS